MTDPPRYGRLRLGGDLDEFHHALNALAADTCERGRCDGDVVCTKHEKQAERRRRLRLAASNGELADGGEP